jgi:hypothetical protein
LDARPPNGASSEQYSYLEGNPKQRHRVLEIGVQQRLMFDQGESGPVSSQRRAKLPQPIDGSATSLR